MIKQGEGDDPEETEIIQGTKAFFLFYSPPPAPPKKKKILATLVVCESSQARDQTCTAAVTWATAMTTPDP